MINRIEINSFTRRVIRKSKRILGMNGENLQEVLLFVLDEKIEGSGIVEVELPDGTKGMIEVSRTEEGYELPVKSSLLAQTGFVKFQLRIVQDNKEVFKSEKIELEVKESINATETIPEQYPTWIDNLEALKLKLEKSENERESNEEKRQSAEEARQENFTEMQKTVASAVSNIEDLKKDYDDNAIIKTKAFNDNFETKQKEINDNTEAKIKAFDENSDNKVTEYDKNHTDKMKEFNDNFDTKTKTFDDNAAAKLAEYNKNDKARLEAYNANDKAKTDVYNANDIAKTKAYNDNTVLKEKTYNDNAATKTETFNTNAEQKETELEELAEEKINEYNQVSAELTAKVEQVQAENEALKAENKLIKEQITSANASGNSIHIEDSGSLDFDWKIRGGHKQETVTDNLFENVWEQGAVDANTGAATITTAQIRTGYIKVYPNVLYSMSRSIYSSYNSLRFYDKDKNYLGYQGTENMMTASVTSKRMEQNVSSMTFTILNSNVAYMRVVDNSNNLSTIYTLTTEAINTSYPGRIKTINNNVRMNIVNKNYFRLADVAERTVNGITYSCKNGEYTFNGTATAGTTIDNNVIFDIPSGNFYLSRGVIDGTAAGSFQTYIRTSEGNPLYDAERKMLQGEMSATFQEKTKGKFRLFANPNAVFNNYKIKPQLERNSKKTNPIEHQSQTAIIPIQKEMLEGDYITAEVEHHEWGKLTLTGDESWSIGNVTIDEVQHKQFYISQTYLTSARALAFSNTFKNNLAETTVKENYFYLGGNLLVICNVKKDDTEITTIEDWKTYLQNQNAAGTPVMIYYKLATSIDLELTSEQKVAREQKLYTYKNITNVDLDNDLASIDVEYKKDPTLEHNELQKQIDEIKQLISTTQTSAMLLDNMQKDVESEV